MLEKIQETAAFLKARMHTHPETAIILGQPQQMAEVLAKWSTATTFVNAVVSTILVAVLYNALRPVLLKSGMLQIVRKTEEVKI